MSKIYPWDFHKDLTADRLTLVAALIADGRRAAVERFDEVAGDNGWTLGCRAFQFGRARILRAIDGGEYPWLTAIDRTLQLIFKIGEVPVRIYRGEADEPTDRTLRQSLSELRQLNLLFDERDEGRDLAYRFAVETDIDGDVLSVKFVGLRGDSAILNWDIPLDGDTRHTSAIAHPATASVELPAPIVTVGSKANKDRSGGKR